VLEEGGPVGRRAAQVRLAEDHRQAQVAVVLTGQRGEAPRAPGRHEALHGVLLRVARAVRVAGAAGDLQRRHSRAAAVAPLVVDVVVQGDDVDPAGLELEQVLPARGAHRGHERAVPVPARPSMASMAKKRRSSQ
jgi:hypothetical protein